MKEPLRLRTCCPRQMRGPALNGRKMNGFAVKYLFSLSSIHRSGSKYSAVLPYQNFQPINQAVALAHHPGPNNPSCGACRTRSRPHCGQMRSAQDRNIRDTATYPMLAGTNTRGLVGSGLGTVVSLLATRMLNGLTVDSSVRLDNPENEAQTYTTGYNRNVSIVS